MADGTQFVNVTPTVGTPEDYLVSGAATIDVIAVRAVFDGTGAGGDFLPVLQILNEAGQVELTFPGSTVTAGDSADITFAPFLKGSTSTAPALGAIRYDFANIGGALSIITKDSGFSTTGFFLDDQSTDGIVLRQDANGPILIQGTGDGPITVQANGAGQLAVEQTGPGGVLISDSSSGGTVIQDFGAGGLLLHVSNGDITVQLPFRQHLIIDTLPTFDPGVSGALWNNGGVINISP